MRFSWKAILLAPLAFPFLVGGVLLIVGGVSGLTALLPGIHPLLTFLTLFGLASLLSYGATLFLFLPCLFFVSRFVRLTAWLTSLIGVALGVAVYLPLGWQSYLESGDNSGPPSGTFADYLSHSWSEAWPFPLAGLITALLYWLLAQPSALPDAPNKTDTSSPPREIPI